MSHKYTKLHISLAIILQSALLISLLPIVFGNNTALADVAGWSKHTIDSDLDGAAGQYVYDINGDGNPDIVAAGDQATDIVWYEAPDNPSDPWNKHNIDTNYDAEDVYVYDIDGDGNPDIAAASYWDGSVVWYEAPDDPTDSWVKHNIDTSLTYARSPVQVHDVDGDGNPDVVATAEFGDNVVWYEAPDDPTTAWTRHVIDSNNNGARHLDIYDIDDDGNPDTVVTSYGTDGLVWYESPDDPTTQTWGRHIIDTNCDTAGWLHVYDIDTDGDADVAATIELAGRQLVWYECPADPTTAWTKHNIDNSPTGPDRIYVDYIDADFNPDIAAKADNRVIWYEAPDDPSGAWATHVIDSALAGGGDVHVFDIDSDGDLDVAATGYVADDVVWYENLGTSSPTTRELIVFSSDIDGQTDIWLMNADGSNPTNLTPDSAEDYSPELSPDGTKIAFSSDKDGDFDIYVMDIDGNNVYRVTNHSDQDFCPSWSPDGSKIVFSSQQLGSEHTIYIANSDGSGTPTMCFNLQGEDAYPSFNIDGTRILFYAMNGSNPSKHDIYSADLNGDNLVQHTNGGTSTTYHAPRYSPDYTKIVFSAKTYPSTRTDLYVMSANAIPGDPWTRLTNQSINNYASWSLDGSEIVFCSDRDGDWDIYVMQAVDNSPPDGEGDNLRNLTSGSSGWERSPFVGNTNQPPATDTTPPEAVTDLSVSDVSPTTVTLSWTAPGDDSSLGIASQYDIRMSESTITEGNWASATQLIGEPAPNPAGSAEAVQVTQLTEGTTYYFALKTADEVPNWSGLSNIVTATPTATNTPAGPDVHVDLGTVEVTFDNVDTEGVTYTSTATVNQCGATPSGYQVVGLYTDVTTTAICDPGITVGIRYTEVPNIDENTLRFFHCEGGQWVDRTTSVDTANNIIYGRVDSLSWFFIGGRWVWVDGGGVPVFPSLYIGISAAFGACIVAYLMRRRLAY